jgi:hypothetical protein
MTEGEGDGLDEGLGSTQSGLRALRKFDESSPRWNDDEELLVVAILSTLGLRPCWLEPEEVDEGVAEVVLNLRDDDSAPPPLPPSNASGRKVSLLPVVLDDPCRCFVFLSRVTRSGLLALPGDLYIDRRLV